MSSFTELIESDPEEAERLAGYAVKEDPDLHDFPSFETALKKAFNTDAGRNALSFINDQESKRLFETEVVQNTIKNNVGEEKYEQIEGETTDFYVERKVAKGEPTKQSDIKVIKTIRYSRWTPAQKTFIKSQKKKKLPIRQVVVNYNQTFKEDQRNTNSIKGEYYRIN
jgi:hypothetical protein